MSGFPGCCEQVIAAYRARCHDDLLDNRLINGQDWHPNVFPQGSDSSKQPRHLFPLFLSSAIPDKVVCNGVESLA